jgi:hypothetical protein
MQIIKPALALLALTAATPALATGGFRCTPTSGRGGPTLVVAHGHGIVSSVIGARLQHGRTVLQTGGLVAEGRVQPMIVGQSWIDREEVKIDLLDSNAMRFEGQLRARVQQGARGFTAIGTLARNGRTWRVRCVED